MMTTRRTIATIGLDGARLGATIALMLLGGCGRGGGQAGPITYAATPPPVLEAMPQTPTLADKDLPGTWERIPGVDPPARLFRVGANDAAVQVILVHSLFGVDDESRQLARELAQQGFAVSVPDLFDGLVVTSRLVANQMEKSVALARNQAILDATLSDVRRRASRVGLVGISSGGAWGYGWLSGGAAVDVGVFDSTQLQLISTVESIKAPITLLVGSETASLPAAARTALEERFRQGGVNLSVVAIEGAGTDLFDHHVKGFSATAREIAFARLVHLLREP